MEILGVGITELIAILIVMLAVAGPTRMMRWAFTLGRWAAQLQAMWRETAASLQRELDASGVDVKLPARIPTRQTLHHDMQRALRGLNADISRPLDGQPAPTAAPPERELQP